MAKVDYLQKAKDYAISRGGECLATEYVSVRTKTQWNCSNPNHPIFENDFQIIARGSWCVLCHREEVSKKYTLSNGLEKCQAHAIKNGGQCLSTEYKNAKTKMKWQCKYNHTWESNYDHTVTRDRWCQQCHYDKAIISDGFKKITALAKINGGSVKVDITDEIKLHSQLEFKCANAEHKPWIAEYRNVMNGTWCPYCAGKFNQEEYLELAKKYANSKGGSCLSTIYENQNTKLEFKCHNSNHKSWFTCYNKIVQHNAWCKECRYENNQPVRDNYLKKAQEHAISKGGACLSNTYINTKTKLLWQCSNKNHKPWEATYGNIVNSNKWCPRCSGQFSPEEMLENAKQHALSKHGQCLSTEYITTKHLEWKCSIDSHKPFKASHSNVLNHNLWCSECHNSKYIQENYYRVILENLLDFELKKSKPSWNINPHTGFLLELDGYNECHKFGFEYQGRQHFQDNIFKNGDLESIKKRDKAKKENCLKNNVFLLIINANRKYSTIEKMINHTIDLLTAHGFAYFLDKDLIIKKINDLYITKDGFKNLFKK